ncbi:MAG: TonB-dependent receptor [Chitinophagaceae bacterium]|mgnify:CR=1 FL=1|nr:MAG: TonB-dependent receptor [Bacteroidetes bacterium OLB11]MCC6447669.1 TonB-dependent receptor [Chitinophagaceae bacterium]HMN32598.1 TonB-dependent receptor [Chitinophagaceae bacterium]
MPFVKAQSQTTLLHGTILEKGTNNTVNPVVNAKIIYDKKIFTFTDKEGKFKLNIPDTAKEIEVQYAHVGSDFIQLTDLSKELQVVYPLYVKGKEIVIKQKRFATEISLLTMQKTERISSKELLKAACCNLSESFETTPSVDVSFTDAVTGYKQIQLLGLAGPYTLITRENLPEVRGLASITGLTFTPGQWIEGMQLSKGAGSVVNGYEGLAGQINIELRKPMEGDKQFYNLYQSGQGRSEGNAYFAFQPVKGKLYTNLFLHGKSQWLKVDQNDDHFIDQPLGNTYILTNRWMYFSEKGFEFQFGAKYNSFDNWGGNIHYEKNENPLLSNNWGLKINTNRLDTWAKIGKVYEDKQWKSMGLQLDFSSHNQNMLFGKKLYDANENNFYANYIFQSIIKNTGRVIKIGATFNYLNRKESLINKEYINEEIVPGIYGEYAHTFSNKVNAVLGLRGDYHNLYGFYFTPRFHIRYAPIEKLAIRGSIGKAYRTASIFSENLGMFSTNRKVQIIENNKNGFYGLQNESAYNAGLNATYKFKLNYRNGTIGADYYYTHFNNQVVADWEMPGLLSFYNMKNGAYANSFQVQLDYEPIRKFDVRLAYRFHDVKSKYINNISPDFTDKPLNAKHRAFANLAYTTHSKWSFDYTIQWTGSKRIPSTGNVPESIHFPKKSPSFITMNAHIGKTIYKNLDLYGGVENILNYMQQKSIIDPENPFGNNFDGSLIWGPISGRNFYVGLRFKK